MHTTVQNKQSLLSLLKANGQKLRSFGILNLSPFGSFITCKLHAQKYITNDLTNLSII